MTRREEQEPRRDCLTASSEVPKCGRLLPVCLYLTAHGGDEGDDARRAAGHRDRARAEAWRASHRVWYRVMEAEAIEASRQGCSFSVDLHAEDARMFRLRNDLTPALARLLIEEHPELSVVIRLNQSRCDEAFPFRMKNSSEGCKRG